MSFQTLSKSPLKIGVLYWSENIEGQVIMGKGLEDALKKYNKSIGKDHSKRPIELIKYVAGDGALGIKNQVKQFYELIEKSPDAIIVQPTDNAALGEPLQLANKKGIPVIAYDQYILGGKITSFITSNNYQAGFLNGEYIDSLFPNDTVVKIILVEYPMVSSTIDRVDGFFDALKEGKQKYKVLKSYRAVEPIAGQKAGKDLLKDFPNKGEVDVVFTINDGGGLALVKELIEAQRAEIIMATVDGDPLSVEKIMNDQIIKIDTAQFCAEIGRQAMKNAIDLLNGKSIPRKILIPTFPITKETIKKYTGWSGEIPASFSLPWKTQSKWDNKLKIKN